MTTRHTSSRPPGYTAYKTDGCRCYQCANAVYTYNRDRERAILNGTWQPFVDAQPVRDHLAMLAAHGIGWRRAARLAALSTGTVSKLLYGAPGGTTRRPPSRKVRAETAHALLAIRPGPDTAADHAVLDATGYRRRLQALVARGFTQQHLAGRLGQTPANFHIRAEHVLAKHHRAARALYDELWDANPLAHGITPFAANRALRYARNNGWPPPAAWDDDTIDNPDATPDLGEKTTRRDALAEDADFIARTSGVPTELVADRLGITTEYLKQIHRRTATAA